MQNQFTKNTSQGFSLIELLVAVSIIIVISAVALFNQAKFSSNILISNMAYEVALTIRQAQVYGISSRGSAGSDQVPLQSSEQYRVGYGVHFQAIADEKPEGFLTFVDVPNQSGASAIGEDTSFNYRYNPPGDGDYTDVLMDEIDLTQGQKIRRFCAHATGGNWYCWDPAVNPTNSTLDIVFVKPDPDAHITMDHGEGPSSAYDQAEVVIESGLADKCRTVRIWTTGQVAVDAMDADDPSNGCDIPSDHLSI